MITGLVLYSLTILVRNIMAGLDSVPEEAREAARGMGYGPGRLLLEVELPLALPALMAGLRIATVSTIALTTVGSIVGRGGLGNLIEDALPSLFKAQVLTASVLCVLLAVVADLLLLGVQRLLTPWTRDVGPKSREHVRRRAGATATRRRWGATNGCPGRRWTWLTTGVQLVGRRAVSWHRLGEHVYVSGVALALACAIALPSALFLGHIGKGGALAVNISNVGRAIPVFAVLALFMLSPAAQRAARCPRSSRSCCSPCRPC